MNKYINNTMKRGESNKRPVIITWPNNTESYCESINFAAELTGLKRDCISKSLLIGYFKTIKNIKIRYA